MSRAWTAVVIVAICALAAGFLVFGGANMGH